LTTLQPGQMVGEYKIISQIGKGGMATVYKAFQTNMERYVAIKVLSFQLADNEEFLGRFKQEARLIARLEHPNILPIYDFGEDKGIPFLVVRYLEAGTLKDRLQKIFELSSVELRLLNEEEIDRILTQLTDALEYAHENGVIHRDIKPSNILLDGRNRVFLTDFGIAKLIESTRNSSTVPLFTATGAITGTPDYMSPEQAQGLKLDQRSDIYSLGIVLYEMLTGKVPFDAETPIAVLLKHIAAPLPPPSLLRPDLHPALEAVVIKALAKSPDDRYASMNDFLAAWKQAYYGTEHLTGNHVGLPQLGLPQRDGKGGRRLHRGPPNQMADDGGQRPLGTTGPMVPMGAGDGDEYIGDEFIGDEFIGDEFISNNRSATDVPPPSRPAGILHGMEHEPLEQPQQDVDSDEYIGKKLLTTFRSTQRHHRWTNFRYGVAAGVLALIILIIVGLAAAFKVTDLLH